MQGTLSQTRWRYSHFKQLIKNETMRKQIFILLTLLTGFSLRSSGQITLEHTFYRWQAQFYYTDIGNNDFRYVFEDTTGFKLYDPNYNLSLQVVTPIQLWTPPNYYLVAYITKSLFDCDSSNIEYVINAPGFNGNFYVYRTDGTLLFSRDSVTGNYCIGCADGSLWTQPIFSTPTGTKLWLHNTWGLQDSIWAYSLCGELPANISDNLIGESFVKVFPNPTTNLINFEITMPNSFDKFNLTVYNSSFQTVHKANVTGRNYQLDLSDHALPSGGYFFDLRSGDKVFQTGKFVIAR